MTGIDRKRLKALSVRIIGTKLTGYIRVIYQNWKTRSFHLEQTGHAQSNESKLIDEFTSDGLIPHSFCEFGFDIKEFNCGRLAIRGWRGLLIDGDEQRVLFARRIIAREQQLEVVAESVFLDVSNVRNVINAYFGGSPLGVLSIDVDGNDYWLLKELILDTPCLIVVEYNASFGLRSITVPYDPRFERHEKHRSGWYHGASITALYNLCVQNDYCLVAVSQGGQNLFFLRSDLVSSQIERLNPTEAYRENMLRNKWSRTSAALQWDAIRELPFVEVQDAGESQTSRHLS